MNLQEYISEKLSKAKKVSADAEERWQTRVVPRGLDKMGEAGARQYLSDYGRGIAAPKCIALALCAYMHNANEMATGFWKKAYELEIGALPVGGFEASGIYIDEAARFEQAMLVKPYAGVLPEHLRPGKIVTMQPVDAPQSREYYIGNPMYWGQPKRDGNRLVVVADRDGISYQSRSMKLRETPSVEMDKVLLECRDEIGEFVLDGELYYPDFEGGEHRTGAQAATYNIEHGHADVQPQPKYAIFRGLYGFGNDYTSRGDDARIETGEQIGAYLTARSPLLEVVPTAVTIREKTALVQRQRDEGREGEVWTKFNAPYTGGKDSKTFPTVRTKYLQEIICQVRKLTATTAEGRLFGAAEVTYNGEPVGSVASGFDFESQAETIRRFRGDPLMIKVITQGFTEKGQLMHPRFVGFAN